MYASDNQVTIIQIWLVKNNYAINLHCILNKQIAKRSRSGEIYDHFWRLQNGDFENLSSIPDFSNVFESLIQLCLPHAYILKF